MLRQDKNAVNFLRGSNGSSGIERQELPLRRTGSGEQCAAEVSGATWRWAREARSASIQEEIKVEAAIVAIIIGLLVVFGSLFPANHDIPYLR